MPQHDRRTTTAWIKYAKELAEGLESTFEAEANLLIEAFQQICHQHKPEVIAKIYMTIHIPGGALLPSEIPNAAIYAEQGADVKDLCELATNGKLSSLREPLGKQIHAMAHEQGPTLS